MQGKYFTVEVKPDIDGDLLATAALAGDDDVIFSWTPFEVPKGSSKLLNVTARVAGADGAAQHHPFQLLFAKSKIDVTTGSMSNPPSMGEFNTVATAINSKNYILGSVSIEAIDYGGASLVGCSVASTGNSIAANGSNINMVLTPSGTEHAEYLNGSTVTTVTPGKDILWIAGIANGAMQFSSTVTSDGTVLAAGTTVHTDTKDANLVFSVGDVIQEADNTVIGTVTNMSSPTGTDVDITVDRTVGDGEALADGIVIYPRNPITLELSFEK